ncbi:MAG: B12-binding domain-containing radical SAM protein [Nitrospirae bacterium]|nr:B12-binding domain-containing radical SAM protein [Nitrospirota bacterium]
MAAQILLINPRIGEASQNKKINAMINITFPTSIGVLAGYLNAHDVDAVRIVDEQVHPIADNDIARIVGSMTAPKIIGFSVLTLNCGRAYDLAARFKEADPGAVIVFGGIHPTVATEEVLGTGVVDVAVRGEGEETFRELVARILQGNAYHDLAGISFVRDNACVHNPDRPMIQDLDTIPPFPYHLFKEDLANYPNFSGIFGSRGCPYKCTFCSSRSISGRKYRHHSVGRVIEEMKTLVRTYGQTSIFLMDDNIAVNKKHFKELCDSIIREGLHKEAFFHGSLRGDNASEEVLEMAWAANFRILYYGLETGSEALMKIIDKGETVAEVADAIKRAAARGFSVGTTIIFGLPTETRKDRYETMRFVKSLPLSSVRFNTLTPYPGTPVFLQEFPKGHVLIKKNWENFGVQYMWESDDIPYVPEGNERIELIFDTMWANLSYYLGFRGIKNLLTAKYAAGNVVKLQSRWYLSFQEIRKMADLFFYLFSRFMSVSIRMFWGMLKKMFSVNRTV